VRVDSVEKDNWEELLENARAQTLCFSSKLDTETKKSDVLRLAKLLIIP